MKQTWKKNISILLIATLLSKIVGFFREIVIASKLGISDEFDVFLTVFVLPNIIISLLLYAMPHIVIPRLNLLEKSEERFYTFFSKNFFWPYILFLLILVIAYNLFFQIYIKHYPPEEFKNYILLASNLTLIFTFFTFFCSTYNILKAVYNAKEKFALPAFTPLIIHISVIFSITLFYESYGVMAFAYGLLIGSILQILVYVVDLNRLKLIRYFKVSFQPNKFQVTSYIVILLIEFLGQSYTLIDRSFLGKLPEGHVSSLYYAGILNNLPISVIGLTIGAVIFPRITIYAQEKNISKLKEVLVKGGYFSLGISIPFLLLFTLFGIEIIKLILERGAFSSKASLVTSNYLFMLSLGLPFIFYHIIVSKICFALKKEKILLLSTLISVAVKMMLSYYFIEHHYYWGLSLSTSLCFMINVLIIGVLLYYEIKRYKNA